ncbi:14720_t:CDS:2, partial [Racocetra persica]
YAKSLMYSIPNCDDKESVFNIFDQLLNLNEDNVQEWVDYYRTSYIIASLNYHCSKINYNTWIEAGNNTNAAEAAHAYANRSGKQGKKLDEITINRIQVHIKFGVPITQRDSGEIKRKSIAMT